MKPKLVIRQFAEHWNWFLVTPDDCWQHLGRVDMVTNRVCPMARFLSESVADGRNKLGDPDPTMAYILRGGKYDQSGKYIIKLPASNWANWRMTGGSNG